MGGGGGKQETGSSKTELPDWMEDRYKETFSNEDELYDLAKGIAGGMDPREILGVSDMEKLGLGEAMEGFEKGEWFLDQAGDFSGIDAGLGGLYDLIGDTETMKDYTTDRIGDKTLDEMRESYESEYTDDIVDTTLANADRKRERERLQAQAAATATGGTSNTRSAIGQAVGDQLYGMNRAEIEAGLRDDAFRTAAEFGQSEAGLGQKEDQMNYDFLSGGTEAGRNIWGDILSGEEGRREDLQGLSGLWQSLGANKGGVLSGFGEMQRALEQGQLDADRTHDMDMVNWLSGVLGQNKSQGPGGVGETTEYAQTPGMGQQLLGLGTSMLGGWMSMSDEDMKEDITDAPDDALETISQLAPKEYEYTAESGQPRGRTRGLIAQEVEKVLPQAVVTAPDGTKFVDSYPVAATIVKAVNELDEKTNPHRRWRKNAGVAA